MTAPTVDKFRSFSDAERMAFLEKHRATVEWRYTLSVQDWVVWIRYPWGEGEQCVVHGWTLADAVDRMIRFSQDDESYRLKFGSALEDATV